MSLLLFLKVGEIYWGKKNIKEWYISVTEVHHPLVRLTEERQCLPQSPETSFPSISFVF